jgi:hypothetical protein
MTALCQLQWSVRVARGGDPVIYEAEYLTYDLVSRKANLVA